MRKPRYFVVDKDGKSHGWCLTPEFAKRNCGKGEKVVKKTYN